MTPDQLRQYIAARTMEEGECLIWTGAFSGNGQPTMRFNGERRTVRSVVLEVFKDTAPKPRYVATSTCECRACVADAHCKQISKSKMLVRSRRNTNEGYRAAKIAAGHAHRRKLSDDDIRTILTSPKPNTHVALELGVHHSLVSRYRSNPPARVRGVNPFAGLGAR